MRTDAALGIGGVAAETLAQVYGTPLLALDTDALDARVADFAALGAAFDLDVSYAGKALLLVALARRLAATPLGLDVCSLGELLTAERAGYARERLVMHGCGKTDDELGAVVAGRVGRVVVDHFEELAALRAMAAPKRPVHVLLRINTGIEAHTHAYVRTGGEDSKFGFALGDLPAAVASVLEAPGLRLAGLHSHLGSQIFEAAPYVASLRVLLGAYASAVAQATPLGELVVGGGFGIPSTSGGERLDVAATLRALAVERDTFARTHTIAPPRLGIEPGRAIVAEAGTSLYRVAAVKRQGSRRFVIVDGGIADNPRPALYGAVHEPALANRVSRAPFQEMTVCGRSCENDRLVVAPLPSDLQRGDLVAFATTGAYTYSMASNYNRFPRPAVVFAGGGTHHLAARRETDDEVLRHDALS